MTDGRKPEKPAGRKAGKVFFPFRKKKQKGLLSVCGDESPSVQPSAEWTGHAEATRALLAGLPRRLDLSADSIDATMARQAIEAIPRPTGRAGAKSGGKGLPSVPAFKGEAMARRVKACGAALCQPALGLHHYRRHADFRLLYNQVAA